MYEQQNRFRAHGNKNREYSCRKPILDAMLRLGINQAEVVRLCRSYGAPLGIKFSPSDLSAYIREKHQPKGDKAYVLCRVLHITERKLYGYKKPYRRL